MERYDYMRTLTKPIHDSDARIFIARELQAHMDDQKEAFIMEGMTPEEAEREAVRQMGDPKEVGRQFGSIYNVDKEKRNMLIYAAGVVLGAAAVWGLRESIWKDEFMRLMFTCAGWLAILYGILSGILEKLWGLPFFYGKSQRGGLNLNSYFTCITGAVFVSEKIPAFLILAVVIGGILYLERSLIGKAQAKKTEKFIFRTGVAVTDIDYKGKAEIGGEVMKVRVKKEKIRKGCPLVIVNVEGSSLIAEEVFSD